MALALVGGGEVRREDGGVLVSSSSGTPDTIVKCRAEIRQLRGCMTELKAQIWENMDTISNMIRETETVMKTTLLKEHEKQKQLEEKMRKLLHIIGA